MESTYLSIEFLYIAQQLVPFFFIHLGQFDKLSMAYKKLAEKGIKISK